MLFPCKQSIERKSQIRRIREAIRNDQGVIRINFRGHSIKSYMTKNQDLNIPVIDYIRPSLVMHHHKLP